ncbi:MAG: restriction endonuclease subunit S, partial [Flavipsychrobacter sp.]
MKGWSEKYFNDFIKLNRGFDLPNDKIKNGVYPIVASTNIKGFHETFKVNGPGVVTGRSGSLGTVQYVEGKYWPLNTSLYVKDFKGNNPKYVYYFLQTMHLENFDSGAGVPTLNQNHLHKVKLFVPDIPIQKKIASILNAYDDLIEVNNERIKILEETARELYKEWFVRMRFPGYKKAKFNKGIPEGWEVQALNYLSKTNSKTIKSKQENLIINYIDISSVSTSKIDY